MKSLISVSRLVYICSILILFSNYTYGQFSIVSTSPSHGSQAVDTAATFSITFNSPIDTSVRFDFPGDVFMNMYFYPMFLLNEPDSITLSPDMHTVNFHNLHLTEDTTYFFIFVKAVSQSGDTLDQPHSIVFSTGTTLTSSTVSGTVSLPGGNPAGTVIALFDANPFGNNEGVAVVGTVSPTVSGLYSIQYVENGVHWPAAINNFKIDEDGDFQIDENSLLGFVDNDFDSIPDSIEIFTNSTLTNINLQLKLVYAQTAKNSFTGVQLAASGWAADAFLVRAGTFDVDSTGNSNFWQYSYYSPLLDEFSYWFVTGDLLAFSDSDDETEPQKIPLPQNWMDTDSVLSISENAGGAEFRNDHPDTEVLIRFGFMTFGDKSKFCFSNNENYINKYLLFNSENIEPAPAWMLQYVSDNDQTGIFFMLDPVTGDIISDPQTAYTAEAKALPLAQSWSSDAKLSVVANYFSELDTLGKAQAWNCIYYSAQLDSFHTVLVWGKVPVDEGPPDFTPLHKTTIPENWVDSDIALSVAEDSGGREFRQLNPDYSILAELTRWFFSPNPEMTVWIITYSSTTNDLQLIVDASNGLIVGVEEETNSLIPQEFRLYQNFPNPFNPTTKIKYELPKIDNREPIMVKLVIYDILGNEIKTLINEPKNSGVYEIEFDASKFSSGIYYYQLKVGNFKEVKKMVFLK